MLIKIKNEIIRMNHPAIQPEKGRANFISPKKLQEWLDRGTDDLGRPVMMVVPAMHLRLNTGLLKMHCTLILKNSPSFQPPSQPTKKS